MTITPEQCGAARILTHVDRDLLATASGVPAPAIAAFEESEAPLAAGDLERVRQALERLGADFIPEDEMGGAGVRLRFDAGQARQISAWEEEGGTAADDDVV